MSEAPMDEVIEYLDRYGEVIPEGELLSDLSNVVAILRTRLVRVTQPPPEAVTRDNGTYHG